MDAVDFLDGLLGVDKLEKGTRVKIIGKDEFKGFFGFVKRVKDFESVEQDLQDLQDLQTFTIELEATGKKIDRKASSLKKVF